MQHSLAILRRYRRADIRYCILRELIVAYARPFSANRGETYTNHHLTQKYVPTEFRVLHNELLALRGQLLAHTDLAYHRSRVSRLPRRDGGSSYPMSFRNPDYESLERNVGAITRLTASVMGAIDAEIARLEVRPNVARPCRARKKQVRTRPPGGHLTARSSDAKIDGP